MTPEEQERLEVAFLICGMIDRLQKSKPVRQIWGIHKRVDDAENALGRLLERLKGEL